MKYKVAIKCISTGRGQIMSFKTARAAKEFVAKANLVADTAAEYLGRGY